MAFSLFSPQSLARTSSRHPWRVIAVWVVILVASMGLIMNLMSDAVTNDAYATNDPESMRAEKLIEQKLKGPDRIHEAVIIQSSSQTVDAPAFRSYVQGLQSKIDALGPEVVESSASFYSTGADGLVSKDRRTTMISVVMAGTVDDATKNAPDLVHIIEEANAEGQFRVLSTGFASISEDFNKTLEKDLQRSETYTVPVAIIVLVLVFGALAAALLPVFSSVIAIVAAIGLTAVIGQEFRFAFFVTNMIFMMGLAVGIDYCLFIVSRFREERGHGFSKEDAISIAGNTAGRAVLFSGLTVVVALLGLLIVPQTIFRSLAGGAILVVLTSVAASLTLLPAVLQLMGDKVNSWMLPGLLRTVTRQKGWLIGKPHVMADPANPSGFWDGVARGVMAHPVVAVIAASALLIAAAVPYFDINVGFAGVSTLPDSFQSKQGFQVLTSEFAGGDVYPAEVVISGDVRSSQVQAGVDRLKQIVSRDSIFGPANFTANSAGDFGLLEVQLIADPNANVAIDAAERLRNQYVPEAFEGVNAEVLVGGLAAENLDGNNLTSTYLPIVIAFVLTLSFLLLMMVFRSIVVPAKAILMNLLSVGAAYGLIVLIFQKGTGNEIFGFQQVEAIEAWLPLFLFSILFGLSMDYHVFLLSRIKEHYDKTGDNTGAVAFGLRSTGRLITGAALIMVAVFGGFALGDLVMFQQMGFGLGVAVLIDATIIRSILVPASMKLLGRWNWYLPPVLSWLPHFGIETPAVQAPERRFASESAGGGS